MSTLGPLVYRFKKPRWQRLFAATDRLGWLALGRWARRTNERAQQVAKDPKRLLVLRLDQIGDVLVSTPAIHALRVRFPRAHLSALVGSWSAPILEGNPDVDEVVVLDAPWFASRSGRKVSWLGVLLVLRRLRQEPFDLAVDLRGDFRNLCLMAAINAPVRAGYADTGGGFLLTHTAQRLKNRHEIERSLDVVRTLGANVEDPRPFLAVTEEDRRSLVAKLAEYGLDRKGPLTVLHPGSGCSSKLWDPQRFAAVGDSLVSHFGAEVLVTGAPNETALAKQIVTSMRQSAASLAGRLTLKELAALFEQCSLVVTVDAAPMHIAAAMGRPVVAIFSGITTREEWAPWGERHVVLQSPVPCLGCELPDCPRGNECMAKITVAQVVKAAEKFLGPDPSEPLEGHPGSARVGEGGLHRCCART